MKETSKLIKEARELCEKAMALEIPTERLDYSTEYVPLVDAIHIIPELVDALEKAERESGCEWCKTPSHNPDIGGCTLVFYRSKAHPIGAYAISVSVFDEYGEEQEPVLVRIDNCIHCGKRLEEHHEAD